jgi:nuclear-control-of-ATPase protein 2
MFLPCFYSVAADSAYLYQDTRAEGRGRIARRQRRLLLVEVEKGIAQYQTYVNQGLV